MFVCRNQQRMLMPFPREYRPPLPRAVEAAVSAGTELTDGQRSDLLTAVYNEITQYTLYVP